MLQCGERACLTAKTRDAFVVVAHIAWQHLDGHVALQFGIARAVDLSHAAFAEQVGDLVVSEGFSDHVGSLVRVQSPGSTAHNRSVDEPTIIERTP